MGSFDFITSAEFRASLESDYSELHRAAEAKSWKAVHVLAGSIVEALLVDYLAATPRPARAAKDVLRLDLAEAIVICKAEDILTDRTADLCSVIRAYRNLIHPGRLVRLGETAPTESSAQIAVSVVDVILDEVSTVRKKTLGLTADQVVSKIVRDAGSLAILKLLLMDVSETERERLVLSAIPEQYFALQDDDPFISSARSVLTRLERAFRLVLETVPEEVRTRAAEGFVRVLREADGDYVATYGAAFFSAEDLRYLSESSREMVKQHLLSLVPSLHTVESLARVVGLASFLEERDVKQWLDPFIRTLVSASAKEELKQRARRHLLTACSGTPAALDEAIDRRLDDWVSHWSETTPANAEAVRSLKDELGSQRFPF